MQGKIAKAITRAKNTPKRKKYQKKSVALNLADVLGNTELGDDQVCMNIAATLPTKPRVPTKPRGRPKNLDKEPGKTLPKSKNFTTKEIQAAASMLEYALGISSQPNSCSSSVVSTRSNLSWTRDISSSESSFLSYPGLTYMTGTISNDIVMFNNKLPQIHLEKCALPKVKVTSAPSSKMTRVNTSSVTQACLPPSVLLNDESSSSDSESSSSSSSSSDSKLNLSTSSLTSRVPISDFNIGQHLSMLTKKMKNFIQKFVDNVDDDFCSLSDIHECISPVQNTNLPDTYYCNDDVPFDLTTTTTTMLCRYTLGALADWSLAGRVRPQILANHMQACKRSMSTNQLKSEKLYISY